MATSFQFRGRRGCWLCARPAWDLPSLVIAGIESLHPDQARLTFAMARHAAVDLAQVVNARYDPNGHTRLSSEDLEQLRNALAANGLKLRRDETATQKLSNLRSLYEPYVEGMARNLIITLPPWIRTQRKKDNWQGGPWDKAIQRKGLEEIGRASCR